MNTTFVLSDELLKRAKRVARSRNLSVKDLVEEGLRRVIEDDAVSPKYVLPDCSVGEERGEFPLSGRAWHEVRELIYGADSDESSI